VLAAAGCVSNPTPHPGVEDAATGEHGGGPDVGTPVSDKGPDSNNDGVPDCEAAGGLWDATAGYCRGGAEPTDGPDGGLSGGGDGQDGAADGGDGEDGDAGGDDATVEDVGFDDVGPDAPER